MKFYMYDRSVGPAEGITTNPTQWSGEPINVSVLYGDTKNPYIIQFDGKLFFSQNKVSGNGYMFPLTETWGTSERFSIPQKYHATMQMVRRLLWRHKMGLEFLSDPCKSALEAWLQF